MKYLQSLALLVMGLFLLISCGSLKAPIIKQNEPISSYRYFYIMPTPELTSSSGGVYGSQYGVYGRSLTKTIIPSDIISGTLLKQGFVRLPEIDPNLADKTLIVNYGESGRRSLNFGYSIEVTIQFLSAQTHSVVCVCTQKDKAQRNLMILE